MNTTALSRNWLIGHKEPSTGKPPFLGTRGARRLIIVGVILLSLAVLAGVLPRLSQRRQATADTKKLEVPNVAVVSPSLGAGADGLMLPAEIKPWQEASIFSRVNGYLKSWTVDIGAHVEQDQMLAEIDTPDLDHQLEQARSQATLAQKSLELAKSTNNKWQQLWHQGVVSELDAENMATSQATNQANTEAFAANLRVLEQQVAFKRVTAPFAGTITARNLNVGDLIVANNTSMEMFHIQQTNPLRIYFRVPQANAPDIHVDQTIDVVFPDLGGKTVPAKVAATSESIAANSRTLLVELHLDNPNNQIQPGSYAQARLTAASLGQIVTLPNNTLLFRAQGLQVGVVKSDNTVELRDIKVGRDFGTTIEIVQGITPSDRVILNPADSLVAGDVVRIAPTPEPASSPGPEVARK
jgi:membrane fusion protein (multidrug efflux system)